VTGNDLLAGWRADPSGQHQHRYWDATRWTDHVADDGITTTDPWGTPPALSAAPAAGAPGRPGATVAGAWRTFRRWPRPGQITVWVVVAVVVLGVIGAMTSDNHSSSGASPAAHQPTAATTSPAPKTVPTTAAKPTTTVPKRPPTAVAVAGVLKHAIPINYSITDITSAAKTGVTATPYVTARLLTEAATATANYDVDVYVFASPAARAEAEAFWATNLAAKAAPADTLPLSAAVSCGPIHVDLQDGYRQHDPTPAVPKVQAVLTKRYGPC
jgi:hypothetical protein